MKKPTPAVQIALADDHHIVCDGLKSIIEGLGNYKVLIVASSGLELVQQLKAAKTLPDICIVDISMKPLNGYETTIALKHKWPQMKIIALSMYDNEQLISSILAEGAGSYLLKNCHPKILRDAIESVQVKGYYHTETTAKIMSQKNNDKKHLTDKELHYLSLCCIGLTQKEIASEMSVATRTVDNYRDSLFEKCNKHSRTGLALFAANTGLIHLSVAYLSESGLLSEA